MTSEDNLLLLLFLPLPGPLPSPTLLLHPFPFPTPLLLYPSPSSSSPVAYLFVLIKHSLTISYKFNGSSCLLSYPLLRLLHAPVSSTSPSPPYTGPFLHSCHFPLFCDFLTLIMTAVGNRFRSITEAWYHHCWGHTTEGNDSPRNLLIANNSVWGGTISSSLIND